MNNVILFGPPGIGKSTLIGDAKASGLKAVDLEDIDGRQRYQMPSHQRDTVLGAADLDPSRVYPGDVKVLLWMPQAQYEVRRDLRDARQPGKKTQKPHLTRAWLTYGVYDYVLDARKPNLVPDLTKVLAGQEPENTVQEEVILDARNKD
jgi:hypothetical protein